MSSIPPHCRFGCKRPLPWSLHPQSSPPRGTATWQAYENWLFANKSGLWIRILFFLMRLGIKLKQICKKYLTKSFLELKKTKKIAQKPKVRKQTWELVQTYLNLFNKSTITQFPSILIFSALLQFVPPGSGSKRENKCGSRSGCTALIQMFTSYRYQHYF